MRYNLKCCIHPNQCPYRRILLLYQCIRNLSPPLRRGEEHRLRCSPEYPGPSYLWFG